MYIYMCIYAMNYDRTRPIVAWSLRNPSRTCSYVVYHVKGGRCHS